MTTYTEATRLTDIDNGLSDWYGDAGGAGYDTGAVLADVIAAVEEQIPERWHILRSGEVLVPIEDREEAREIDWAEIYDRVDFGAILDQNMLPPLSTREVLALIRRVSGRTLTASTWRSYVSRGQAPAADSHIGREPLWYEPTIREWMAR